MRLTTPMKLPSGASRTSFSILRGGGAAVAALCVATGCTSEIAAPAGMGAGNTGVAGTTGGVGGSMGVGGGTAAGNTTGGSTTGGSTTGGPAGCIDRGLPASKRVVRLTLDQINYSIAELVAQPVADQLKEDYQLQDPVLRQFPALLGEGQLVSDLIWSKTDGMANKAGTYVRENFTAVTGCTSGDFACVSAFATSFMERAARRPLLAEEAARIQQVVTEVQGFGATTEEAAEHAVYAALSSPQFQYRTEFGTDVSVEGMLAPYELASMLSYFITGGPPDEPLLAEAAAGTLNSADALRTQATRLLESPEAREYLQSLMLASFGIPNVFGVVLTAPEATQVAKNSMVFGARLFINEVLWSGAPVNTLLTSQEAWVNETLAPFYGVSMPPAEQLDADGFGKVTLTPDRAGLLTNVGLLTSTARPGHPSVVARGIRIVDDFLCLERAPLPDDLSSVIEEFNAANEDKSEREKAELRFGNPVCANCHLSTDPYGLSLFVYDEIGRFRETDPEGRPIDPSVVLPDFVGGQVATSPAQMAQAIVDSGAFMGCVAGNLMEDAIGVGTVFATDCSAMSIVSELETRGSMTFPDLVREVAASPTMTSRKAGL